MISKESGVRTGSDYFIYTPSSQAKNLFLYPVNTGHFLYSPGYRLFRSSYDSFLLIFIRKGNCTIETCGKVFHAHEDQIVFLDCYIPHSYYTDSGWEADWLHFDGRMARSFFDTISGHDKPVLSLRDTYRFEKYFKKIYLVFHNNESVSEAVLNNWIINVLTELLVMKENPKASYLPSNLIEDIIAYIGEHLTEELALEELAGKANLSPFYFTRLFKKETGFTPHEYVIAARVNNAKFLLKTTDHSVKTICFMTGFSNESSFCTTFRKVTGVTPTIYREEAE